MAEREVVARAGTWQAARRNDGGLAFALASLSPVSVYVVAGNTRQAPADSIREVK